MYKLKFKITWPYSITFPTFSWFQILTFRGGCNFIIWIKIAIITVIWRQFFRESPKHKNLSFRSFRYAKNAFWHFGFTRHSKITDSAANNVEFQELWTLKVGTNAANILYTSQLPLSAMLYNWSSKGVVGNVKVWNTGIGIWNRERLVDIALTLLWILPCRS